VLPSSERLRRKSLFQRTYAARKSVSSPLVTLYVLPRQPRSAPNLPHVGFVVGKNVDKRATRRNRAKRRLREAYRKLRQVYASVKQWYSMVWVIHSNALTADWQEVLQAVDSCLVAAERKYGRQRAQARQTRADAREPGRP